MIGKQFAFIVFFLSVSMFYSQNTEVDNTKDTDILATQDGLYYTEAHFDKSIRFIEFLTGTPLQDSDIEWLRQEALRNFHDDPQAVINEVNNIDAQMQQLYQTTDISQIAYVRSALICQIYLSTQQQAQNPPVIIQILNKYVIPLALDSQNLLAFTYKDFEAYIETMKFYAGILGQELVFSNQEIQQIQNTLVQQFYSMNLEQKKLLCSMQIFYEYLSNAYNNLTPVQKRQWQEQVLNQYYYTETFSPQDSFNAGYQSSINDYRNYQAQWPEGVETTEQKQAYLRQRQREYNGNQAAMKIYYDTMMSNHATMLNVFSNYDSNTYWEYKY
jgi:transcription termination factor NusB